MALLYPRQIFADENHWKNLVRRFYRDAMESDHFNEEEVQRLISNRDQPGLIRLLHHWAQEKNSLYLIPPFQEHDWLPIIQTLIQEQVQAAQQAIQDQARGLLMQQRQVVR